MKVILTDNVKSLGSVGEVVSVSQGFGRNYLIPNKLAILADESNQKQMADYQKMLAKRVAEQKADAEALAKQLNGITLNLIKKVGGNGRLFGTVTTTELSAKLAEQGIEVEKRLIHVDTPVKALGTFDIKAKLFKGVEATFKVKVEMDPQQAEEMKKKQEAAAKKAAKKGQKTEEGEETQATEESTEA